MDDFLVDSISDFRLMNLFLLEPEPFVVSCLHYRYFLRIIHHTKVTIHVIMILNVCFMDLRVHMVYIVISMLYIFIHNYSAMLYVSISIISFTLSLKHLDFPSKISALSVRFTLLDKDLEEFIATSNSLLFYHSEKIMWIDFSEKKDTTSASIITT